MMEKLFRSKNTETQERKKDNKQYEKELIAAILLADDEGKMNTDTIDQEINFEDEDEARESAIKSIIDGKITPESITDFLNTVEIPNQEDTLEQCDKHELRILGYFGSEDQMDGFNNYDKLNEGVIINFLNKYPNPLEFEEEKLEFLDDIKRNNSEAKYNQYIQAMDALQSKIYGEQFEYSKQFLELLKDADFDDSELENSSEWVAGDSAVCQTSRAMARDNVISRASIEEGLLYDDNCQDSSLSIPDDQLYGVFDGAGGVGSKNAGRDASRAAVTRFAEEFDKIKNPTVYDLVDALKLANESVVRSGDGASTATVVKIIERNGKNVALFASVGDTRLYRIDENSARQVTKDEGFENKITNALGIHNDRPLEVKQFGEIILKPGEKLMLCSDGITGDKGTDLMSDEEVFNIVSKSKNADDAAKNLCAQARKTDDRTAIVFTAK